MELTMKCRHAKDLELGKISELLAREFKDDHLHKILFPIDDEERIDLLRRYFRIYVDLAQKRGGTLIAGDNAGVLVYFRPEALENNKEDQIIIDRRIREVCGPHYAAVAAYTRGLEHFHPRTPPHYYIPLLAVKRSSRGRGVVNNLFAALHSLVDKDKSPCYAECTRFSTRTLLMRWGYGDAGTPIRIDCFPELFPVWRNPVECAEGAERREALGANS
jgi:hypothetical protein